MLQYPGVTKSIPYVTFQKCYIGGYISSPWTTASNYRAITANRLYGRLIVVPKTMAFDQILINVQAAGGAGTAARLGLYKCLSTLLPGALVTDYGTVAVDSTGTKTITITPTLTRGLHYLALVSDGTPTLYCGEGGVSPLGLATALSGDSAHGGYAAFTYGVLSGADPFPTMTLAYNTIPVIALRVAS
mgnify:FL=1